MYCLLMVEMSKSSTYSSLSRCQSIARQISNVTHASHIRQSPSFQKKYDLNLSPPSSFILGRKSLIKKLTYDYSLSGGFGGPCLRAADISVQQSTTHPYPIQLHFNRLVWSKCPRGRWNGPFKQRKFKTQDADHVWDLERGSVGCAKSSHVDSTRFKTLHRLSNKLIESTIAMLAHSCTYVPVTDGEQK